MMNYAEASRLESFETYLTGGRIRITSRTYILLTDKSVQSITQTHGFLRELPDAIRSHSGGRIYLHVA